MSQREVLRKEYENYHPRVVSGAYADYATQINEVVTPVITHIINVSLLSGEFSENRKDALLKLLIKKMGLEIFFKSFHPVSNLSNVSKLVEICNPLAA